ncbi:hypothetical protein LOZ46_001595 [Ophidiomyces ophidiicola]|nr:hypothetical protein LOZ46_001595 [Ophidiomyces ophidiicola]
MGRPSAKLLAHNPVPAVSLNKHIRAYVNATQAVSKDHSWISNPEIPSSAEILGIGDSSQPGDAVFLNPNKIVGPWQSKHLYLKTHYDLLREDAVAPLRDAVAYVRQDPRMKDTLDICIYEKVHIIGVTFSHVGVAVKVQFSTVRAGKNIVWEYSKRLISGNIVALTPASDGFQRKCVIAIVAARPLDGLKAQPCEVDLLFANPDDVDFDCQQEWLMVEARNGYYEAHRHTLTALQKMSRECFPLAEYICDIKNNVETPEYIMKNPIMNMSELHPTSNTTTLVNVSKEWPSPPEGLDQSQWRALRQILTKKLSIIQGPPGTGKTYVSVVAIKILLANMLPGDPPIIIAAQTNHALDQLLRHVAKFENNYVRLGGRSTDPEIKKRTVFELRNKSNLPYIPGGTLRPARNQLRAIVDQLTELIAPFVLESCTEPLQSDFFLSLGIITQEQHESLIHGAEGWFHAGDQVDPMSAWLDEQRVPYNVTYKTEHFGFAEDEVDLEYEQLKELEAEQGLDDDDFESLRGHYMPLREGYTGRNYAGDKVVREKYLKYQDMWEIPTFARGRAYTILQNQAKNIIRDKLRFLTNAYATTASNLKVGKWERDSIILQGAKLIGMTTTGLSKYRALISSLKPKIILIEEAAEILEAPVTAACVESLEHLILVGDHKQLHGQCALKELEGEPYFLGVSMFERLVNNNVEFQCLTKQRRMAPEIRRVLAPIYDNLEDHEAVLNRPDIPGMGGVNSYFFCHVWPESSDSLLSKYNEDEAKMVVGFFVYLHMNGVPVEHITVLTFYNGQRKKILKALKDHPLLQGQYVKVVTVDSYQGEENEVVLLSLVRSNDRHIGFLSVENRVCVALSRAKRGFYIFGNAEALSIHSALWWQVAQIMRQEPKRIGYFIPVTCSKHNVRTLVRDPRTWAKSDGGCLSPCGDTLDCGHKCPLRCHAMSHESVRCERPCRRLLPCGHECEKPCFIPCECDCPKARELPVEIQALQRVENLRPDSKAEQVASVQRYRDFANGGARKADAQLALATQRLAVEEQLRVADEEAFASLFGEDIVNTSSALQNSTVTRAPDIAGTARYRYVQYYSNASGQRSDKEEVSLLDL